MTNLFDQISVPSLHHADETPLEDYLEPNLEQSLRSRRHSIKQFCQSVLHSREYRSSLLRRIEEDSLPAQVETMLYHFAYGKPVERVEFNDVTETNLENKSLEELEEYAARIFKTLASLRERKREVSPSIMH